MTGLLPYIAVPVLLGISNIFMTFAWYGHLKFKAAPLILVIVISWGILLCGPGQSNWSHGLFRRPVENHPGSRDIMRIRRFQLFVLEGTHGPQPIAGVCADRRRRGAGLL